MCLTLLDNWEQFPSLLWLDSMWHGPQEGKLGNLAKKWLSQAFLKDTTQSLATGQELLASTLLSPLMTSPVKLKTNNLLLEIIKIQVWEF